MIRQRQAIFEQRPSDDLVDGVVPADVLADDEQFAVCVGDGSSVHGASSVEDALSPPHALWQRGEHVVVDLPSGRVCRATPQQRKIKYVSAAYATCRRCDERT